MSKIHIDTTTEKDTVCLTFSAPTEREVLTDALHTVLHLLRATCKMGSVDTAQFNSLVQTACELEDQINQMLEDNAIPEITATIRAVDDDYVKPATVPCDSSQSSSHAAKQNTDAQSFKDSITEVSRNIVYPFITFLDENLLVQSDENEKVNILLKCMKECCDEMPLSDPIRSLASTSRAGEIAIKALWILLILHHAKDPIRNITAFSVAIMNRIVNLLVQKNHDYGNSFGDQLAEDGPIVFKIRMKDKISRLRTLLTTDAQVKDESIEDTLRDIIGYCILFLHHYQG